MRIPSNANSCPLLLLPITGIEERSGRLALKRSRPGDHGTSTRMPRGGPRSLHPSRIGRNVNAPRKSRPRGALSNSDRAVRSPVVGIGREESDEERRPDDPRGIRVALDRRIEGRRESGERGSLARRLASSDVTTSRARSSRRDGGEEVATAERTRSKGRRAAVESGGGVEGHQ
ncbi:hypothetical protein THAOC_05147 [Thalassiosira oceanica]|uniref:Uncharacterized protein n=1 Tax=Thalassiosira oceanica TaxID=159749 RepID=K0T6H3_THAOC|nr:hypothetical protein THAOC_05147 [Thalassiosira oceanica]|eukprot:EJK73240.1 hypothetical protein THAOC_05147 [Thalassiosira oceanica]